MQGSASNAAVRRKRSPWMTRSEFEAALALPSAFRGFLEFLWRGR